MSNIPVSSNSTASLGLESLSTRLPNRWSLLPARKEPDFGNYRPDALVEVRAPDGSRGLLMVEAKSSVTAQQAANLATRLVAAAEQTPGVTPLLITRFASSTAQQRLREAGVSYLDLTGNIRIALERPALLIQTEGADRDPMPTKRGIKSLKGAKGGRLVRGLCDWRPPVGVRELARRAEANPGYVTRVLQLLRDEDIITKDADGTVIDVNWRDLLQRWAQDYQVAKANRAVPYLAARGLDWFKSRLASYRGRWALTGSLAVPSDASTVPGRLASCYVDVAERAGDELDLRPAATGANVLLLEPFDEFIWERTRDESGLKTVAMSQCAVDLITGTGREPSEAEGLMDWMARNEDAWRT